MSSPAAQAPGGQGADGAPELAPEEHEGHSPEWWLAAVRREERRGELLAAFDVAERGLGEHPDDLALKHRAVLALARAGATDEAARRLQRYGLADIEDEDIAALSARIAKDAALASAGTERAQAAAGAAERYAAIYARTGGYYPAINAATLWLIAGDAPRARALASEVLAMPALVEEDSYYSTATEGEARLLLGDREAARSALQRAAARHGGDYGALATTRRQLRTICEIQGIDTALLSVLAGPAVVHFCGHMVAAPGGHGRFPQAEEQRVAALIAEVVQRHHAGFAYGSLAGGADILWAEALLAHGCELHIVLPFALEEFIRLSVEPCGPGWTKRFERCLAAATAVEYATSDAFLGDDVLFRYCSELAMGLALLRARYLDAEVRQLTVWDGGPAGGAAGTSTDVATWRRGGRPFTVVSPDPTVAVAEVDGGADIASAVPDRDGCDRLQRPPDIGSAGAGVASGRVVRAMLFGDTRHFSRLTDEQLPIFAEQILGTFADVVHDHHDAVCYRNTWGDAIYVVLTDVGAAASCALDLQDAMEAVDLPAHGLPTDLALRLGGHFGPVFPTRDPVVDQISYMGSHVSRTARIEPITPPGAVYVTGPFAAALVLEGSRDFVCDYMGQMPAAKHYGVLPMYRLRRNSSGDSLF